MPNGLPLREYMKRPRQRPAPIVARVNGRFVVYNPQDKNLWQHIAIYGWFVLFVVLPLLLGILEMVQH